MHKSSCILIATFIILAGCGTNTDKSIGSPSSARLTGETSSAPKNKYVREEDVFVAKWRDEEHTNAMLRTLAVKYINSLQSGDYELIKNELLTEDGFRKTTEGCQNNDNLSALKSCITLPAGTLLVEEIKVIDETHAEIVFSQLLDNGELINPAFILPAVLKLEGPKLEDGRFKSE